MLTPSSRSAVGWLIAGSILVVAWQVPYGGLLLYPFSILATWFHEMGHGLMALVLGGRFEELLLFPDGSGLAIHSGAGAGRIGRALVAAAGPMGPPLAGALFILSSRRLGAARLCLSSLGITLLASGLVWVRSLFGLVAVALLGLGGLALARRRPSGAQTLGVQVLGVQACLSSFHQVGYLLTRDVVIAGRPMLSDSAQVADSLFLPYWFWGGLMAAGSVAVLVLSLRLALRRV